MLGQHEYARQQRIKKKAANIYGPRVTGPIDDEEYEVPVRKILQEPQREPRRQDLDGTVNEAEAAGQEPGGRPPGEAEGRGHEDSTSDPDDELRREVVTFVREHPGTSEAAIRRGVTGSTTRIRRLVAELLEAGALEDRGDGRRRVLHVKHE